MKIYLEANGVSTVQEKPNASWKVLIISQHDLDLT